jgi:hypothetical protein
VIAARRPRVAEPRRRCARAVALSALAVVALLRAEASASEPSEPPWQLELRAPAPVTTGAVATVALTLGGRGRHQLARSGLVLELSPSPGLSVRQRRYQRRDAIEPDAAALAFELPVRGEAAGRHLLTLRVQFWVCTPRLCVPIELRREVVVEVADPPRSVAPSPSDGAGPEAGGARVAAPANAQPVPAGRRPGEPRRKRPPPR